MMTGIWGLRHQEEHRARDNVKTSKTSLLVHTSHDAEHFGPDDREETQHEVHSHRVVQYALTVQEVDKHWVCAKLRPPQDRLPRTEQQHRKRRIN